MPLTDAEIRGLATGFAPQIKAEIERAIAPLRTRLDHLAREIALLKVQERGRAIRETVQAHEGDDD